MAIPRWIQAWPNRAACWSPIMPPMGTEEPKISALDFPKSLLQGRTSGKIDRGISNSSSNPSSQAPVSRLNNKVRQALDMSVAWTVPPVRFHSSQQSIVPKASWPASAAALAPSTLLSIQAILEALKYGSSRRPVVFRTCCWVSGVSYFDISVLSWKSVYLQ